MVRDSVPVAVDAMSGTALNTALVRAQIDVALAALGRNDAAANTGRPSGGPPTSEEIHRWASSPEAQAGQSAALAQMRPTPRKDAP